MIRGASVHVRLLSERPQRTMLVLAVLTQSIPTHIFPEREDFTMSNAKHAPKRKRGAKAVPVLGAVGLLSLAGSASAATNGAKLPESVPSGLERLSSVWTAPIPDYAPPVLKSASFGYVLSAMAGTGLIMLTCLGLTSVFGRRNV